MSQIDDLKNKPENSFNFIELVEKFSDEKDAKYIKLVDKLIKERINEKVSNMSHEMFGENAIENAFIAMLFSNIVLPQEMVMINYFCKKHKTNAIPGVDVQTVDFSTVVNKATEIRKKELEAQKENMVEKIHEDDEWLILLPLSYEASLKYGGTTKWCTAARSEKTHYNNYTKKGILIYCISKKTKLKYGFFNDLQHSSNAFSPSSALSLWDTEDNFVELIHSDLPISIIKVLSDYTKKNKVTNDILMKNKYSELFGTQKKNLLIGNDAEIIRLTKEGKSLAAVKLIKEIGGIGLKEAKDIFDNNYRVAYYPES